jgi:hypothetical protein
MGVGAFGADTVPTQGNWPGALIKRRLVFRCNFKWLVVGAAGFEPATCSTQTVIAVHKIR